MMDERFQPVFSCCKFFYKSFGMNALNRTAELSDRCQISLLIISKFNSKKTGLSLSVLAIFIIFFYF